MDSFSSQTVALELSRTETLENYFLRNRSRYIEAAVGRLPELVRKVDVQFAGVAARARRDLC